MSPNGGGRHMAGTVLRNALRQVGVPAGDYARATPHERRAAARLMRKSESPRVRYAAAALEAGDLDGVAEAADPAAEPLYSQTPSQPPEVVLTPVNAVQGRVDVRATLAPSLVREALDRANGAPVAIVISHALLRGAILSDREFADFLQPVLRAFDEALGFDPPKHQGTPVTS